MKTTGDQELGAALVQTRQALFLLRRDLEGDLLHASIAKRGHPQQWQNAFPRFDGNASRPLDGAGQNLERRYRLEVWKETVNWMQSRCSDLVELERERDAASIYLEFRLKG